MKTDGDKRWRRRGEVVLSRTVGGRDAGGVSRREIGSHRHVRRCAPHTCPDMYPSHQKRPGGVSASWTFCIAEPQRSDSGTWTNVICFTVSDGSQTQARPACSENSQNQGVIMEVLCGRSRGQGEGQPARGPHLLLLAQQPALTAAPVLAEGPLLPSPSPPRSSSPIFPHPPLPLPHPPSPPAHPPALQDHGKGQRFL